MLFPQGGSSSPVLTPLPFYLGMRMLFVFSTADPHSDRDLLETNQRPSNHFNASLVPGNCSLLYSNTCYWLCALGRGKK